MLDRTFTCLRQRARVTLVGKHRPEVIVDRLEHGPKYVSLTTLKSALGTAGLFLSSDEIHFILQRFSDNRRRIEWKRLLTAMDVGPPADFTDPERVFFEQPYHLIVDILDNQIVDQAWAMIIATHPELETSLADETRAKGDIIIKRSCPPSTRVRYPHPIMRSRVNRGAPGTTTWQIADSQGMDTSSSNRKRSTVEAKDNESRGEGIVEGLKDRDVYLGADNITAIEWDQHCELLFTGGENGSVCFRFSGGTLDEISAQLGIFSGATSAGFTTLSRPVGALRDPTGQPSSVRIAAAATTLALESKRMQGEGDEPTTEASRNGDNVSGLPSTQPPSRCRVSVFEVTMPKIVGGFSGRSGNSGGALSFQAVHFVDLPEEASSCALSSDGHRLAIVLVGGRIMTWILPPTFPSAPEGAPQNATAVDVPGPFNSDHQETNGTEWNDDDCSRIEEIVWSARPGGGASPATLGTISPTRMGAPEFCIPNLPSPQQRVYKKALQAYTQHAEAGKIPEKSQTDQSGGHIFNSSIPPSPLAPTSEAYHLPHVHFLPKMEKIARSSRNDESILVGGGGLIIWRVNSNVCRLYRLPYSATASNSPSSPQRGSDAEPSPEIPINDEAVGGGDMMGSIFDIASLPSVEWILPSPVTASEVCVTGSTIATSTNESRLASDITEENKQGENDGSLLLSPATPQAFPPIVAIGTQNGGVYLSDAILGTRMQGLSRHRARVTSLAFHGRRFLFSGSDDEMVHIHDIENGDGGGTTVICLHGARGSGIIRVACFQSAPLAFAEDTSGRIVAYDLVSGSMLGVLESEDVSGATSALGSGTETTKRIDLCAESRNGGGSETAGLPWACGRDCIAVATSTTIEKDATSVEHSPASLAYAGALGVWTAADVIWGLCPAVRAAAGNERPKEAGEIAQLFDELGPAIKEPLTSGHASKPHKHYTSSQSMSNAGPPLPRTPILPPSGSRGVPPSPNVHQTQHRTQGNPDFESGAVASRRQYEARSSIGSGCPDAGGSCEEIKTPRKSTASRASWNYNQTKSRRNRSRLTADKLAQLSAFGKPAPNHETPLGNWAPVEDFVKRSENEGRWEDEVGSAERIRRYMEARKGERAARETRLRNVTRDLLRRL